MGLRFRKSLKIAPGVKLNISKSGLSTSIGKHGAGINISSRGTYANIGLPGTGISTRQKISGRPASTNYNSGQSSNSLTVSFKLTEDGQVELTDENGNLLPPKLKKIAREQNKEKVGVWLQEQCDKWNKGIDKILGIHLGTPASDKKIIYEPEEFSKPAPTEPRQKSIGIFGQIFQSRREAIIRSNEEAVQHYKEEKTKWDKERVLHEEEQEKRQILIEKERFSKPESMEIFLEENLLAIEWPRETTISMEISKDGKKAMLDVDLPEIEDLPTEQAVVAANGFKINVKKRTDSRIRKEYMTHIHGVIFRLIGETFVALPTVDMIVASGFSQRPNKATGQIEDEYLISVKANRENWNKINFNNLQAVDLQTCLSSFEIKRDMTSTGVFKPIEPLAN